MPSIHANIIDLHKRLIFAGAVTYSQGKITKIRPVAGPVEGYLLPGFVDAHVHIESSMLTPVEFGRLAVLHGTVGTVSDPHEIANVLGSMGVEFMLQNAAKSPFKCCFGAPSCVPATQFETAGAILDADAVEKLLARPDIYYLSEMMNFPGVLHDNPGVLAKIAAAKRLGKPVDGHAPGLRGEAIRKYIAAGITTDHECFTYEEGLEKCQLGMKILIREGSAAKNFEALIGLLPQFPHFMMFCSDDKHPDDLVRGHINQLVLRALAAGCDLFDVLWAACVHPVVHYGLPIGLLREGDPADFILVDDLVGFAVRKTFVSGKLVAEDGQCHIKAVKAAKPNQFRCKAKRSKDFQLVAQSKTVQAIRALNGEIITGREPATAKVRQGMALSDPKNDLLKIAVVNRYHDAPIAVGFIRGFGLQAGALASCVAHDSHNIVAVGADDASLCRAVNLIIKNRGGISAVGLGTEKVLPLPIAGIMTPAGGRETAALYTEIDEFVRKTLACPLGAPFMTLSFMALPVIPSLKMTDLGLFDVDTFGFGEVFL